MNNESNQNTNQNGTQSYNPNYVNNTYMNNTQGYNQNSVNNMQAYNQNVTNNTYPTNNGGYDPNNMNQIYQPSNFQNMNNANNMQNYNNVGYQQQYNGYQNNMMNNQYYNQPVYQAPKKSSPVLVVLVIILLLVAIGGGVTCVVLSKPKEEEKVIEKKYKNVNEYEDDSVSSNSTSGNTSSNNQTSTIDNRGFSYEKLAGFSYTEQEDGLLIVPSDKSYVLVLTPIESPYQSIKAEILKNPSSITDDDLNMSNMRNSSYSGVDMIIYDANDSENVGYICITAIPSKQEFTMQAMIIFMDNVRNTKALEDSAKIINSAKYVGNSSTYAKDLDISKFSTLEG